MGSLAGANLGNPAAVQTADLALMNHSRDDRAHRWPYFSGRLIAVIAVGLMLALAAFTEAGRRSKGGAQIQPGDGGATIAGLVQWETDDRLEACPTVGVGKTSRSNIVFILADDLGYGEPGCYGQTKIRTPNIDRLAASGLKLTQYYAGAPTCAASRCVLLTGVHLGHAQIRGNRDSGNGGQFPGQWPLDEGTVTLPGLLKAAGYRTAAFGKWGLGPAGSTGSPLKQGFDKFFGYNCHRNAHSYFPPFLDDGEQQVAINARPVSGNRKQPEGEVRAEDWRGENYAPDLILERALKFLDDDHPQPFFLYLPLIEPHVAMQPPQAWVDKYPAAWDEEHGAYRGQNGYLPHPRPRAAYAAMISDLDEHVGAILDRLEQRGMRENTLIVFTSDNGPTHGGNDPNFSVGGAGCEFFNSTGGLRGFKGSCYEGGLRVPCIVAWPGQIAAGRDSAEVAHAADWLPTLARIAGVALPPEARVDGVDLTPALREEKFLDRSKPLIWDFAEYGGIAAIRLGDWKAIRRDIAKNPPGPWELYNLARDPGEKCDLADQFPERVVELERLFISNRRPEADFPNRLYDAATIAQAGHE